MTALDGSQCHYQVFAQIISEDMSHPVNINSTGTLRIRLLPPMALGDGMISAKLVSSHLYTVAYDIGVRRVYHKHRGVGWGGVLMSSMAVVV